MCDHKYTPKHLQRGHLQRPDHAAMRNKCRTYARLLQHIKSLDKSCMIPLRKAYCHSLNLLIRRESREFSNELRNSSKASKSSTPLFEGPAGANQPASITDSPADAYSKMITVFIPLLVDEFLSQMLMLKQLVLLPSH